MDFAFGRASSSYPNSLSGLPSGVLYQRNHSRTPLTTPGHFFSTSAMSLSSAASGSAGLMARSFQSSSPSSIIASAPSGFTAVMDPISRSELPISTTSRGSPSPKQPVVSSFSSGFSQVYGTKP